MEEPTKRPKGNKVQKATAEEIAAAEAEEQPKGRFSLGKYSPLIMPLVIALAVSFFMVNIMATPKGTYNNAVAGLSSRMTAIETGIEEVKVELGTITTSIQGLEIVDQEELDSLALEINNLEAQIAKLDDSFYDNFTALVGNKFIEYEARLDDIEYTLGELWVAMEEKEEEEATLDETTRWVLAAYATNHISEVTIGYIASPYRIEEEDDYGITITIWNQTTSEITDLKLQVALRPRSGDRILVDEDEIYLDTIQFPYYFWDMDIQERSGKTTRILFNCTGITATKGEGEGEEFKPGVTTLRLEFTLAYK